MTTVDKSTKLYSLFDPRSIPNCRLWLDANDSSTITKSNGTNISSWRDKSSGGFNATNASTGPTTVTTGNRTYLSFNGSSNFLETNLTLTANAHTIMIVYRPTANNASSNSLLRAQVSAGYIVFPYYTGTTLKNAYITSFDGTGVGSLDVSNSTLDPAASTTSHNVVSISIASGSQSIYNNGELKVTTTQSISATTSDPFDIGAWVGSPTSQYYTGQLAEVIIYNRTITSTERIQLEGYLAWKWGLQGNLVAGHSYISRNPTLSPFRPTDISSSSLWLDGADRSSIALSGSNVTSWIDKSGNGRNATSVNSPTITTGALNGQSVISFGGTPYMTTTLSLGTTQALTLFTVARPGSLGGFQSVVSINANGATRPFNLMMYATDVGYWIFSGGTGATDGNVSTLLSSTSRYDINANYWSPGSPNGTTQVNINGTAYASSTNAPSSLSSTRTLLVAAAQGLIERWTGNIAEIILYSATLTTQERQQVEGYLAWKWGLQGNLPSTHPYKTFYPLKIN